VIDTPVTLTLRGERPPSWNKAYAGQHWAARKAEADRIHQAIRACVDPGDCAPFTVPVDVTIYVYFANHPQDADNIPAKLYVDGLKGWWLTDDDRRFVRSVRTVAEVDKRHPRVVIEIVPVGML
jgi:hypothetical protein